MTIPIPTLPTDNLYKFTALSGVVMIIVAIVIVYLTMTGIDKQTQNTGFKQATIVAEIANLKGEVDFEKKYVDSLKHSWTSSDIKKSPQAYEKLLSEAKSETKKILAEDELMAVKSAQLDYLAKQDRYALKSEYFLIFFCLGVYLLGFIFSIWGFKRWYSQHQKYIDIMLKHAARVADENINK